jgi:glycosyltransferase involved in cell wall biosynthesis
MKIAIIGIRGIPVIYSGFESFAENLALDLAKSKIDTYVYCRSSHRKNNINKYKGTNLIIIPSFKNKYLESPIHTFLSTVHAIFFIHPKIIYFLGVGNSIFTLLPRFFGIKTIINVDGLDWRREKWGFFPKLFLRFSGFLATVFPNLVITDSKYMQVYYEKHFNRKTVYIPYGFKKPRSLKNVKNGLKKNQYFVWVGRIVPDNHLDELLDVFINNNIKYPLIIIGDDFYKGKYYSSIMQKIKLKKNIIWTGFLNRENCMYLVKNSFAYVETKRSWGTHPSLIEAAGLGALIVSNNNKANIDVLGKNGFYYEVGKPKTLFEVIKHTLDYSNKTTINNKKSNLKKDIRKNYNWKIIYKKYLSLFIQFSR